MRVQTLPLPPGSLASQRAAGAYFADTYGVVLPCDGPPPLAFYLRAVAATPPWVNRLMDLRNTVVSRLGLQNLGRLDAVDVDRPLTSWQVGERIGIFRLLHVGDDEVLLGDSDRHLEVVLSVVRTPAEGGTAYAVTTVVHVHNMLGRVYMAFVAPVHRRIVPAVLRRSLRTRRA